MNNLLQYYSNIQKPLIFLGSNFAINKFVDVCNQHNLQVAGIIDSDYYGNTKEIEKVPVVDSEKCFDDKKNVEYYKNNFVFFCATNWGEPVSLSNITKKNNEKRLFFLELIEKHNLTTISLVDKMSRISSSTKIGKGCFIDAFTLLEPNVDVGDFSNIYGFSGIGHHTKLGKNNVIQRHCSVAGYCTFNDNCYIGTASKTLKTGATFGKNTFIHESVYIRRGTQDNEVVKNNGVNKKKVIVNS